MSIEGRKKLESLRDSLKEFVTTPIHTVFVSNTERDLAVVSERILDDDVTSISDLFLLLELKGQRKVLRANTTIFQDTVVTLEDSIQRMLDEENQTLQNQNKE